MRTITLTLTTRDYAVVIHALMHTVLQFRKEALCYPDGSTDKEECVHTADMIQSLYDNISEQYKEQQEQEESK